MGLVTIRKVLKSQRGSVLILFAIMLTGLLGMAGLAVDLGYAYSERTKLQNAVDAAAIAGAYELPNEGNAIAKAADYLGKHGYSAAVKTITTTNNRVAVTCSNLVDTFFMKALAIDEMNIGAFAAAERVSWFSGPHLVFSGGKNIRLQVNGRGLYIEGSVHSNGDIHITGNGAEITGIVEALGDIKGTHTEGLSLYPDGPWIDMPNIAGDLATLIAGATIPTSGTITSGQINGNIYYDGDLTITGSNYTGSGMIIATGDITINGQGADFSSNNNNLCLYSLNGDIKLDGQGGHFSGALFAPQGTVFLNGANYTVHGSVVGEEVEVNGNDLNIVRNVIRGYPLYRVALVE